MHNQNILSPIINDIKTLAKNNMMAYSVSHKVVLFLSTTGSLLNICLKVNRNGFWMIKTVNGNKEPNRPI